MKYKKKILPKKLASSY